MNKKKHFFELDWIFKLYFTHETIFDFACRSNDGQLSILFKSVQQSSCKFATILDKYTSLAIFSRKFSNLCSLKKTQPYIFNKNQVDTMLIIWSYQQKNYEKLEFFTRNEWMSYKRFARPNIFGLTLIFPLCQYDIWKPFQAREKWFENFREKMARLIHTQ